MGVLRTIVFVLLPGSAYATFLAFRLGPELPVAARLLGNRIGMGFNYFKVILKVLSRQSQTPAEIVDVYRKTNQQAPAPPPNKLGHFPESRDQAEPAPGQAGRKAAGP